jgi:hypothetical protein
MIGDRYDVEYNPVTRETLAEGRVSGIANNLADIFLRTARLKDDCPGHKTTIDLIEISVNLIARELYKAKNELRKLKGEL